MKPGRIIALIVGCLMLLPGIGLLLGGGGLGLGYAFGRDTAGYFSMTVSDLHSATAAITTPSPAVTTDLGTPTWVTEQLQTDVRLTITGANPAQPIFIAIGPAAEVTSYLSTVGHDEITGLTKGSPVYRTSGGSLDARTPSEQSFWTSTATGTGAQHLDFTVTSGQWSMVVMNADGSAGIDAAATFQVRAPFLLPLALIMLGLGIVITAGAIVLVIVGASGRKKGRPTGDQPSFAESGADTGAAELTATSDHPVVLTARIDSGLSRWKWLVKWFLAIPHFCVLIFLWPAFLLVTFAAGVSILFTGVYPRSLFEFNAGVLRWSCRVSYYAFSGGIGTDRYPPFTLGTVPDYPVSLEIAYPERLSRGLVLVKWWLLAIPHYLIIGLMVGNWFGWTSMDRRVGAFGPVGGAGVLGLLVVIAGCILLFTGRYPRSLFDIIIGFNRWIYRVVAYAALMTDKYPPFRLDQGGSEPTIPPLWQPTSGPREPVGSRGGR